MRVVTLRNVLFGWCILGLFACGRTTEGSNVDETPRPQIEAVEIAPGYLELEVGQTRQLVATVYGQGAFDPAVTWSTSDEAIATVADDGFVVAVAAGTAQISATSVADPTKSATIEVKVEEPAAPPGKLQVVIEGLPAEKKPEVVVRGPGDFEAVVHEDHLFEELVPGTYKVSTEEIREEQIRWVPQEAEFEVSVEPGSTAVAWVRFDTVPDPFEFELMAQAVELPLIGSATLEVEVVRIVGEGAVTVTLEGVPEGIEVSDTEVVVAPEETTATFVFTLDGSFREIGYYPLHLRGAGRGAEFAADVELAVLALVTTDADEGPGSLRGYLELAKELELDRPLEIFVPAHMTIVLRTPLEPARDVIVRGRSEGEGSGPQVILDGEGSSKLLRVREGLRVEVDNVAFVNGADAEGHGGAIENEGTLRIGNARFAGNVAEGDGGAIFNTGTLEVLGTSFEGNVAKGFGGAIASLGGQVQVDRSTFTGMSALGDGGAIWLGPSADPEDEPRLMVRLAQFTDNEAWRGGAIAAALATLEIERTTIEENRATTLGGALHVEGGSARVAESRIQGNRAPHGGGIAAEGELTIENSTVALNLAIDKGAAAPTGDGGGLHVRVPVVVFQSTIAENRARFGGGIFVDEIGEAYLDLVQSTVSRNHAGNGGGIYNMGGATVGRSIVQGNGADFGGAEIEDAYMAFPTVSSGHNLFGGVASTYLEPDATDLVDEDAGLGALEENGGPTPTLALPASSPAVDAIPEELCVDLAGAGLLRDQRNLARPVNGACDIGAYEVQ